MNMKIIAGRANTGKSTYIYNSIKDEIDKNTDKNLILLVPDLMTYQTEYDIIESLELEGIIDFEVFSFKRLAHKILDEVGVSVEVEDIDDLGKIMILKQIFEENRESLKLFGKASSHPGFLKKLCRLLKELKQNLISIESLEKAIQYTDNIFLKNKLSDIALIYSKYNEKTKDKFFDEEDTYKLVISSISESDYIKNSKIWIDGFETFNKQRINMIKILDEYSKDISISLNIDSAYLEDLESFDDWEAFKTIYDTFVFTSSIVEKDIKIISLTENKMDSDEIKWIEKNLFALDIEKYEKTTENISIYSSMDRYSELEATAGKIISLVRDHDYRWKDIKIAVGDLDAYMVDIKKLFHKFEIPYFADTKRDITNNPLSKYILSILDMFIWNFKYEDVFEYLKTGLSPLSDVEISHIENYALQYGVEGGKWFKEIELDFMENIRKKFASDLEEKKDEFRKLLTISDITAFLFYYLKLHKIDEKIGSRIEKFKMQNKYEKSSEYSQIWNSIMGVFEQILRIGEDDEITPLEYRKMLETGLMEVQVSIIPPTIDRVEIGDIDRISISNPRALFVIGANEGNLESDRSRGLLLDNEIETLSQYDINIMNSFDYSYFKKKHMIYKLFSSPMERLYISYALGTIDGKSLQPSLYIDILKMIFPYIKEQTDISNKDQYEYISNDNTTYDILVENIRKHIKGSKIDDIWKAVYTWYKDNDTRRFDMIENGFNYKNEIPKIEKEYMNNIFDKEISTTVSKLENYAECQFKYFVKNILKPKPRLTQNIEFYDIGNINHSILEDFINKIIDSNKKIADLTRKDVNEMIDKSIEKVLEEYSNKISALDANSRNRYLKKKIERVLKRTAIILVEQLQRGDFSPKYTELNIGVIDENDEKIKAGEYIPSLELQTGENIVKLRGIVDRVDTFEDKNGDLYLNIIDYKSSKKDIDFTDTYEGIQTQLLVYLKAILDNGEELFGKKPKVAGVYYYHVDDPIIKDSDKDIEDQILKSLKLKGFVLKDEELIYSIDRNIGSNSDIIPAGIKKDGEFSKSSNVFTEDEFDVILNYIESKITELSQNILDGNFDINPYRKKDGTNPCKYCDYISICQFDKALGNEYRQVDEIKKETFLDKISEKAVD